MPLSNYVRSVRTKIGHDLLMLQSVTVMLFDDQHRLLLAQDTGAGLWMTVGGAVEPDETPADAAVRECWEETGLWAELIEIIGVFGGPEFRVHYLNGDLASYVVTVFQARPRGGEAHPDGVETSNLRFVTSVEALDLPMSALTREMVQRAFAYDGKPYFSPPTWRP
jgi:8-oxo-dGTP pyrophosphatase MutT (NUDIX family)